MVGRGSDIRDLSKKGKHGILKTEMEKGETVRLTQRNGETEKQRDRAPKDSVSLLKEQYGCLFLGDSIHHILRILVEVDVARGFCLNGTSSEDVGHVDTRS